MKKIAAKQAPLLRLAFWQLALTILLSLGSLWFWQDSLSALLGGLLALLVVQYVAWRAGLWGERVVSPERLLLGFYGAAAGKLLFLVTGFALLFYFGDSLNKLALLLAFSAVSLFGAIFAAIIFPADRA